jgi:hypothetical protein
LKTITSDPHFFDSVNSIVHTAQHIIHWYLSINFYSFYLVLYIK